MGVLVLRYSSVRQHQTVTGERHQKNRRREETRQVKAGEHNFAVHAMEQYKQHNGETCEYPSDRSVCVCSHNISYSL
jgi:hypothetical protein